MTHTNQTQLPDLKISDAQTARLLKQQHALLSQFLKPQSPSDIAVNAGMAPNLAHHHVKKLLEAGLLYEVKREQGKVYYQLSAREFRVPSLLLPPDEQDGNGQADMRELTSGFLRAYERSWACMNQDEEDVFGFGAGDQMAPPLRPSPYPTAETHPTHLDSLTISLSPERYQRLARALSELLTETQAEGHSPKGQPCTLTVITYQTDQPEAKNSISRHQNSFLGTDPAS